MHRLDDPAELSIAQADPSRLLEGPQTVLIDEWQRLPEVWDLVRRAVDDGAPPGSFLLTGSAVPYPPPTHSGAGRIVSLRMRPLSLDERLQSATVSLADLLAGTVSDVAGTTEIGLREYAEEILASGLPGVRRLSGRALRLQLAGYIDRIVDRDIASDAGVTVRNPALFESLATLSVRVYARDVSSDDGRHLTWRRNGVGDRVLDRVILSAGPAAYRRQDGIAVIPLALLGP